METIYTTKGNDFRIDFNGGKTYFVICNSTEHTTFATDTLRKANNFLKKACYGANVEY